MKKLLLFTAALAGLLLLPSCLSDDDSPSTDKQWRERNDQWLREREAEMDAQGNPVYTKVTCDWDPFGYVLMRWHNDRALTARELAPLYTSTIDVKYDLQNIDSLMLDNSYSRTSPADSIMRLRLNSTIAGWAIGLTQMHVGDSVTMIVPYTQGYGNVSQSSVRAYSNLVFHIKLSGIPYYQTQPL